MSKILQFLMISISINSSLFSGVSSNACEIVGSTAGGSIIDWGRLEDSFKYIPSSSIKGIKDVANGLAKFALNSGGKASFEMAGVKSKDLISKTIAKGRVVFFMNSKANLPESLKCSDLVKIFKGQNKDFKPYAGSANGGIRALIKLKDIASDAEQPGGMPAIMIAVSMQENGIGYLFVRNETDLNEKFKEVKIADSYIDDAEITLVMKKEHEEDGNKIVVELKKILK